MSTTTSTQPGEALLTALGRNPTVTQIFETNASFEQTLPDLYRKLQRVNVSVVSEVTVHNLIEPARFFARCFGVEPTINSLPPYQIEPFLLSGTLKETGAQGQCVVVIFDLEKMTKARVACPTESQRLEFESLLEQRLRLCSQCAQRLGCKVIVSSFFTLFPPLSQTFSHRDEFSRTSFVEHANALLASMCADLKLEVLPVHRALAQYGAENCLSIKDYLASDSPFSAEGANRIAELLARQLAAHFTKRRKLLVLDLDNTLWKGVLGEDGPHGIKYKPDCFEGRVFWHVMIHIKALAESGIVLAINSKNNEHEVLALLDRPDFPLKREDFASIKANWLPKSENLMAISEELGLSLDSMVMLDDSDAECLHLRQTLPDVEVVQVPKRLSEYPSRLAHIPFFERARITEADTIRKLDYQNIHKRKKLAENSGNFDDFLKALKATVTLSKADHAQLDRVEQLFERTNQFNLSGARFKRPQLEELLRQGATVITASYDDSFGSSGVIGALVVRVDGSTAHIDNFVLSCRVLGRSVEHAILANLNRIFFAGSLEAITITFHETPRNAPAKAFLASLSWKPDSALNASSIQCSPHITVRNT